MCIIPELDNYVAEHYGLNITSHDELLRSITGTNFYENRVCIVTNKLEYLCKHKMFEYLFFSKLYVSNYHKLKYFEYNMVTNKVTKISIKLNLVTKKLFEVLRDLMENNYLIREQIYFECHKSHKHKDFQQVPINK